MLYTALTRQRNRIVVMFQGEPALLRSCIGSEHSETACRLTNLFAAPEPVVAKECRYDGKHSHRPKRGELVLSKSEVIIANDLFHQGIEFAYEKELRFGQGRTCKPDFTVEDAATGLTVYWKHCGMFLDAEYKRRWGFKQKWYRDNGVLPLAEGGGTNGILVAPSDNSQTGFDATEIGKILDKLIGAG